MGHIDKRKIIKVGKTSFAVILPISWLRFNDLCAKDYVRVTSNAVVVIEPLKPQKEG